MSHDQFEPGRPMVEEAGSSEIRHGRRRSGSSLPSARSHKLRTPAKGEASSTGNDPSDRRDRAGDLFKGGQGRSSESIEFNGMALSIALGAFALIGALGFAGWSLVKWIAGV